MLHSILNSVPFGVVIADPDQRLLRCNDAFARTTGFTPADLPGAGFDLLFKGDPAAAPAAEIARTLHAGEAFAGEVLGFTKAGLPAWFDLLIWPVRDDAGKTELFIGVVRDVSTRRATEGTLMSLPDRADLILDQIPAGIVIHRANTEIVYANAKATELLGITYDRMLGVVHTDPRWQFFREDGSPLPVEEYPVAQAIATGSGVQDLVIGVHRPNDGRDIWLMGNVYPMRNAAGDLHEIVVSFTDVTRLKRAERALRKSDERLRLAMQGSTDASWDWDLIANELYYSPRWWQMIGRAVDELPNDSSLWSRLLHPDDIDRVQAQFGGWLADRTTSAYSIEFRLHHADDHYVTVISRGAILRDDAGTAIRVAGTNTDITERRRMEAKLQQAQKLEAIGQLAGGIAHDFNNLLAVISGNLELLALDFKDEGRTSEYLEEAMDAARKGASLTRRLLASTRQQPLSPTTVDVEQQLEAVVHVLRRLIDASIRIDLQCATPLMHVRADAHQLENGLLNLAINARDAMPSGGVLTLRADNVQLGEGLESEALELAPGPYVRITVTDTGSGMSRAVIDHALEPFFTTKPIGQGTGLGLSIVYGFVRQSGGGMRIESEVGRGTDVLLYLPGCTAGSAASAPAPSTSATAPATQRDEVVLVVEDDPSVRKFCLKCLATLGYRTLEAGSGPEALEQLQLAPRVDLLLTDVVMPNGMYGPELVAEVHRMKPGLPVLMMSGYPARLLDDQHALKTSTLLSKPFSTSTLDEAIRSALGGSAPPP